jgi:hypothetical protein
MKKHNKFALSKYFSLFIPLIIFSLFIKTTIPTGNIGSRFATVQALVEQNTFSIDNTYFMGDGNTYLNDNKFHVMWLNQDEFINGTNDKVFIQGKYYSDKPPVLSLMAASVYKILYLFSISFEKNTSLVVFILTFCFSALPSAITLFLFNKMLLKNKIKETHSLILTLILGLSTLVFTYSITFNNHIFAGFLIFTSYYLITKFNDNNKNIYLFLIGFLLSLSAVIDIIAGTIFLGFFGLYILFKLKKKNKIIFFIIAVLIPLIFHIIVNVPITGDILPGSAHPEYWNYPSSQFDKNKLTGIAFNQNLSFLISYFFNMIIGSRGLFSYNSILIFSFIGLIVAIKSKTSRYEALSIFCSISLIILYYSFFSNGYGGSSYGIRWFIPFYYILFFQVIHIYKKLSSKKILRLLFISSIMLSLLVTLVGVYQPWSNVWRTNIPFLDNLIIILQSTIKTYFPSLWELFKKII